MDTITLYTNEKFELNPDMFKTRLSENKKPERYYNTFYSDDKNRKQSIYIDNNLQQDYALIQFSVPKLLYGNSIENVKQQDTSKLETILNERLKGIFETDFLNMQVSRLDIAKNMEMENDIPLYIHSLNSAYEKQSRYKTEKYSDETLTIKNNSRRFVFYDKVKEALDNKDLTRQEAKAYGNILRYEISHKKSQHIRTSFNNKKPFFLTDICTMEFFETAKQFQFTMFNKMFCNAGNYEIFVNDLAIMELASRFSKRDKLKNFLIKKMTDDTNFQHDYEHYADMQRTTGMSKEGIRKSILELKKLINLNKTKQSDILEEIRMKLTA